MNVIESVNYLWEFSHYFYSNKSKHLYTMKTYINIEIEKMFWYGNLYEPVNPKQVRVVGLPRELVCKKPYKIHLTSFHFYNY